MTFYSTAYALVLFFVLIPLMYCGIVTNDWNEELEITGGEQKM